MLTEPHIFPREAPPGYSYLDDEPTFEPDKDLRLEQPKDVTSLSDLGYDDEFRSDFPSPVAVTSPLRVLSDTGVEKVRAVIKRLWPYAVHSPDPRVAPVLRGAVYRSRFLRDLSLSPDVSAFFSEITRTELVPTAFPFNLAHINYNQPEAVESNDGWHRDDNGFVMTLVVHDPNDCDGGRFQHFHGTRHEADALLSRSRPLPEERIVSPEFPGPGHAVLLQGSAVVHRAEPLRSQSERFTLGTCYDSRDLRHPDPNRTYFLRSSSDEQQDPEAEVEEFCRYVDYARHKAWRARGHLDDFLRDVPWTDDRELIVRQLAESVREIVEAVDVLRRGDVTKREVQRLRAADETRRKRKVD
ncbi:HalD/BesD family halogenase [Wenjunlia tyrosinilytica]|uniref:Fe2OG dioxygenase domain-containing protein n=1 Tax=Wenjunlia tyrosinilytica TaxID=1544741 RepID=A0A917ZGX6_9ACTN|nr:hypothetical protein [Wenjunlia tyrosinilytica]GGO83013.1 hypothetical protein GCM10012280_10960 [Wenjunlia tyrosinilytica]